MMNWDRDELMIENFLDMRIACKEEQMRRLKQEGWEILNLCRIGGERRYTMVLPEPRDLGYVFTKENALDRFRQLCRKGHREAEILPLLRKVS